MTLKRAACVTAADEEGILQILNAVKIRAKLYTDLNAAVSSVLSNRPSPIILPETTVRTLMRMRRDWFYNTVYWDEPTLMYQFGCVTLVHTNKVEAIAYILHLPKIQRPSEEANDTC